MKTAVLATIGGIIGLYGSAYGSIWFLDGRYASRSALEDVSWSLLKKALRDLRAEQRLNPEDQSIQDEIEDTLDRLCREYPDDRECRD